LGRDYDKRPRIALADEAVGLPRRSTRPITTKPNSIIAHVVGSGTADVMETSGTIGVDVTPGGETMESPPAPCG
jgi:hypothetical protein